MAISTIIWICIVVAIQQSQGDVIEKSPPEFKVDTERFGDVEILYVRNAAGELIEVIEEHANQHYQVIKPTDEKDHVCLIREIEEYKKDDDICYERVPLTPETDEQREDALAKCGDRKVYALEKVECNVRSKRCVIRVIYSAVSFCVEEEKYCARYGWWWHCDEWDKRCKKSEIRSVQQVVCV